MRVSDYTISVPLPDVDQVLLIHGYSGAVDLVDQNVAGWLTCPELSLDSPPFPSEVLETLRKRGYLTTKTPEEEVEFVNRLGQILHRSMSKRHGFIFMPTYNCNLRCFYCFETHIRSRPYFGTVMSSEMVDAAYVFTEEMASEPANRNNKQITLYGGEPFMRENFEAVAYIIRKGLDLGYVFKVITNGVDLDAYMEFIEPDKVNFMQITLDGPPRLHDKRRVRASQYGYPATFADIARNITAALERGVQVSVRTNVDALNIDTVPELERTYEEHGWRNYPNFNAYVFPSHGENPEEQEIYISESRMVDSLCSPTAAEGFVSCSLSDGQTPSALIDLGHNFQNRFKQLLLNGRYPLLQPFYCSSQTGMFLLGPLGDLYTCWDHVGDPACRVGTYYPEVRMDESTLAAWRKRATYAIPECSHCKYALLCGGGCAYQALQKNGTLMSPFCNNFGEMFTRFVPVAYRDYLAGNREIRHTGILIDQPSSPG